MTEYPEQFSRQGRSRSPGHRRGGFSFTEILFAVMILGIGFIMVAAVFPVAIKQTQETVDETTAADASKGAASYLQRIATNANFPVTYPVPPLKYPNPNTVVGGTVNDYFGSVVQYTGPTSANATSTAFWPAVAGNLILSTDPRYAWIPFYSRSADVNGNPLPYAQVTIIAVLARNASTFGSGDLSGGISLANLVGRPATATFTSNYGTPPDTVNFGSAVPNIAEGAYIVIADDTGLGNVKTNPALSANGYVYRVGLNVSGSSWELMPGCDTKAATALHPAPVGGPPPTSAQPTITGTPIQVFVVGRGYLSSGSSTVGGPAMDVAAYSTFIQIRPDPTTNH